MKRNQWTRTLINSYQTTINGHEVIATETNGEWEISVDGRVPKNGTLFTRYPEIVASFESMVAQP